MNAINKDTKLYGSFSKSAGNNGCEFFNKAFESHNINAIYKSFSVNSIKTALESAKYLGFSGCAVSMPFKIEAIDTVDFLDESALKVGNINTILINESKTIGYNTDYTAALKIISDYNIGFDTIYILGNGGLASSVKVASIELGLNVKSIIRNNWNDVSSLKNKFIFNCTPVSQFVDSSNTYIDCLVNSNSGKLFHYEQAKNQFKIYTGINYEKS